MDSRERKRKYLLAYSSKTEIIQNLKDAGCSQETIDGCLICLDTGKKRSF